MAIDGALKFMSVTMGPGTTQSPDQMALAGRVGHVIVPIEQSLSRGSAFVALTSMTGDLLGILTGFILFGAGAVFLIRRRRALAIVPLGVVALFAVAATRIPLILPNCAAALPAIILVVCWGFDHAPWLGRSTTASPPRTQLAVVVLALVSAYASWGLLNAGWQFFRYWDPRPLEAALAGAPARLPIALWQGSTPQAETYYLCGGRSLCARSRCAIGSYGDDRRGDWRITHYGDREVAVVASSADPTHVPTFAASLIRDVGGQPPWQTEGFLLLCSLHPSACGPAAQLQSLLPARCTVLDRSPRTLIRCAP
jgi:hypothetical protein